MPRAIADAALRATPTLSVDETVGRAGRILVDGSLPALPVVDDDERFAGVFGEREFIAAVCPGYLGQLHYAAFIAHSLDDALIRTSEHLDDPISRHLNREHVDVPPHASDAQIAETFLHHRVLIVPVVDDGRVVGVITRSDFFNAMVEQIAVDLLETAPDRQR